MNTTVTPPPPVSPGPAGGPVPPGGSAPRRDSARVVSILAIVVGCMLVAGAIVSGVLTAVRFAASDTAALTARADRVAALDVDVAAGSLTIAYGDVDEATLRVEGTGASDWRLSRDGDALSVTADRGWWRGWDLIGFGGHGDVAVLTLPLDLSKTTLDADLQLAAGEIIADGTFGELDLEIGAGSVTVSGTARSLDASISAGRVRLDLAGVRTVDLDVSAGYIEGQLSGTAPTETVIDVSAGRVSLTLPRGPYAITSDVSAGEFSHSLSTDPTASARIDVTVSAGSVTLRPER